MKGIYNSLFTSSVLVVTKRAERTPRAPYNRQWLCDARTTTNKPIDIHLTNKALYYMYDVVVQRLTEQLSQGMLLVDPIVFFRNNYIKHQHEYNSHDIHRFI